jgi:hypothetical protein
MNSYLKEYKEKEEEYYSIKSAFNSAEIALVCKCVIVANKVYKNIIELVEQGGKTYEVWPRYNHVQVNRDSIYLNSDEPNICLLDIPFEWLDMSDEELEQESIVKENERKEKERAYLLRVQAENEKKLKELE